MLLIAVYLFCNRFYTELKLIHKYCFHWELNNFVTLFTFKVNPIGEDTNKTFKIGITDSVPIISLEGNSSDEKNTIQKGHAIPLDKDKEEKNILSNLPVAMVKEIDGYEQQLGEAEPLPNSYIRFMERSGEELDGNLFQIYLYFSSGSSLKFVPLLQEK